MAQREWRSGRPRAGVIHQRDRRSTRLQQSARAIAALALLAGAGDVAAQQACPRLVPQAPLPFEVIVQAQPPAPDKAREFAHHPATAVASQSISRLNSSRGFDKQWFLWANRCHGALVGGDPSCGGNPKGNIVPEQSVTPKDARAFFTTLAAADACTLAQAAAALGADAAEINKYGARGKIRFAGKADAALAGNARNVDICQLPDARLDASVRTVVLDYEVADRRSPLHTEQFLVAFAKLVKASGRSVVLYTNALDAPSQQRTSISRVNLPAIVRAFDRVTMLLANQNRHQDIARSAAAQLRLLREAGAETKQILPVFDLSDTTVADAHVVSDLMRKNGFPALMIWRNGAAVGGDCNSQPAKKLTCLVFNQC